MDPDTGKTTEWTERVLVVRTSEFSTRKEGTLDRKLDEALEAIRRLPPEPGRGKRVFRSEEALREAIREIEEEKGVTGLLSVCLQPFVTNMPAAELPLAQAILEYRKGWCLERSFHLLKDQPIGIDPLFVQTDDQIKGLTRLLLLANRILSEIELRVRRSLQATGEKIAGLALGSPKQETAKPTAWSLLKRVCRDQITLTRVVMGESELSHLSAISPTVERILVHLGLNSSVYATLQEIGKT